MESMDLFQGIVLGLGLQQLPKVLQALQKHRETGAPGGGAPGGGSGIPGLENVDPAQLMPLLMPLLQAQAQNQNQPPQAGPVPGMPRPPMMGGTPPPPMMPPPSLGRIPSIPRVAAMDQGGAY